MAAFKAKNACCQSKVLSKTTADNYFVIGRFSLLIIQTESALWMARKKAHLVFRLHRDRKPRVFRFELHRSLEALT